MRWLLDKFKGKPVIKDRTSGSGPEWALWWLQTTAREYATAKCHGGHWQNGNRFEKLDPDDVEMFVGLKRRALEEAAEIYLRECGLERAHEMAWTEVVR